MGAVVRQSDSGLSGSLLLSGMLDSDNTDVVDTSSGNLGYVQCGLLSLALAGAKIVSYLHGQTSVGLA